MHYVNTKTILSPKNGMNLYRGCTHGCIYCDSRSDVYNMGHDFEDIEVKQNALELLKKELLKRPKAMIGTGAMTDPYIPLEKHLQYVRKSLELIYRYGFGFTCITKSDLILRDLDLLKKIGFVEILFDFCKNFLIILFFYIFALILLKTFEKFVI